MLFAALAAGGLARFKNLGALELSPDEGASWASASAPTVREVIVRQSQLNPGDLPIHDVMLHGWIAMFGSSVVAMRAMSAALGVLSILLVYCVALELFTSAPEAKSGLSRDEIEMIAALSALVFAVNLVSIKYSREARMYPMMLAAILAQVAMFLRALRLGGLGNYVALAILTALAIGSQFASVLIPATEGIWLLYVVARERWQLRDARVRRALAVTIALGAGGCVLAPKLFSAFRGSAAVTAGGTSSWIKSPPFYAPFAFFNKATGSFAFPILALLAIWGVVRGWQRGARDAVGFALLWMWLSPLLILFASYVLTPLFVERYALSCFVPFFVLAALGIFEIPGDLLRVGALVLAVAFSVGHIVSYDHKPHDVQYREAIAAADAALKPGEVMTVVPSYAIEVLRYYLPASRADLAVRYGSSATPPAVLILGDQNLASGADREYRKQYPQVVARLRGVTVMRR